MVTRRSPVSTGLKVYQNKWRDHRVAANVGIDVFSPETKSLA